MSDYESFEPIDSQVDLSSFDDEFETADAPSYDEVPDGKYQVKIQTAKLESSQKGDPMIKFDLVVISGSQAGRHIFKNSVITQASLPYVKGDLKTLGLELAKLSELAGRLDELLDKTVEFFEQNRQLEGEALVQAYRRWDQARATAQGVGSEDYNRYEKANPTFMSVTGVMRYLSKR